MKSIKQFYLPWLLQNQGIILLVIMCLIGVFTFTEYGISWDEGVQRYIGILNWNYIFNNDDALLQYHSNDHGAAFEMFLVMIEKLLRLEDHHFIFLMRHLVTHLFFLLGGYFCYKLTDLLYKNKFLSVAGFLLFILHPHIYAHSFFNTKDIPFLSLFMICFYLIARMLQNKTVFNCILTGICIGLLINIRLMGVLLLCSALFFLLIDAVREKKIFSYLMLFVLVIVSCLFALYLTWPYLWRDPFNNFYVAFKSMSNFNWALTNLFNGKLVPANELGWEYIPVWFSITTPIPYLLSGLFGIIAVLYFFIRNPLSVFTTLNGKANFIFLVCFVLPVVTVIVLKSVLYDGWRHMFFIYPSFVMLVIYGFNSLLPAYKRVLKVGFLIMIIYFAGFMIINIPFQHLYFNAFITVNREPEYIRKHFELDYWGTSYKQSLEYILERDTSSAITIVMANYSGYSNYECLLPAQRKRIRLVQTQEEATYYITEYRWHPEDYPFEEKKIYAIKVSDNTISGVYKLK